MNKVLQCVADANWKTVQSVLMCTVSYVLSLSHVCFHWIGLHPITKHDLCNLDTEGPPPKKQQLEENRRKTVYLQDVAV